MAKVQMKLFFISLILVTNAFGQESSIDLDHLEPVEGYFSSFDFQNERRLKVREVLFNGLTDQPLIRIVVWPTFSPIYLVSVDVVKSDTLLILREHKKVWTSKTEIPGVAERRVHISSRLALELNSIFQQYILRTRYPEFDIVITDGTTYYFTCFVLGKGLIAGMKHSPPEGSRVYQLTELADLLRAISSGENREINLDKIRDICRSLKE